MQFACPLLDAKGNATVAGVSHFQPLILAGARHLAAIMPKEPEGVNLASPREFVISEGIYAMRRLLIHAGCLCLVSAFAGSLRTPAALAQPALERLEQRIQAGQPAQNNIRPNPDPGYLGVVADDRDTVGQGVRLREVFAGSPAATGGLKTNDLIIGVNNQFVRRMEDLSSVLSKATVGTRVMFEVERDNQRLPIQVIMGARPGANERRFEQFGRIGAGLSATEVTLGAVTVPLTDGINRQLQIPVAQGALVQSVIENSPASQIGLQRLDVIVGVDDVPVADPGELSKVLEERAGKDVQLRYYRGRNLEQVPVRLSDPAPTPNPPGEAVPAQQGQVGIEPAEQGVHELPGPPPMLAKPHPDAARIAELERRIQMMEQRILELEQMLRENQQPK